MNSRTRLFKELKDIQKNKTGTGIHLIPDENDIYKWQAVITVSGFFSTNISLINSSYLANLLPNSPSSVFISHCSYLFLIT
jgi:hypothetical protein